MGYPSRGIIVKDATSGEAIEGNTFAASATTNSKWYSLDDAEWIGLALSTGTASGTSVTGAVTLECRFNGEADVYPFPGAASTQSTATTQAEMPGLTEASTNSNYFEYWRNPLPQTGQKGQVRVKFVVAGTTPSLPIDQCVLTMVPKS